MRKSVKYAAGDFFLVPLLNSRYAVGQIVKPLEVGAMGSFSCVLFFRSLQHPDDLPCGEISSGDAFAALLVTPDLLNGGRWIVQKAGRMIVPEERLPFAKMRADGFVGAKIRGSKLVEDFLNASFALIPWDDWHDPRYLDTFLISPEKKPGNLILKQNSSS